MMPLPGRRIRRTRLRAGGFLGRFGRPGLVVSHAPGWRDRRVSRMLSPKKTGPIARTLARMRAAGTLPEETKDARA